MKAGMLLVLAATVCFTHNVQAEKIDFNSLIDTETRQAESTNQKMIESLPKSETMGFYNTEWLRLRQRKRFAVAKLELKLRPTVNAVVKR